MSPKSKFLKKIKQKPEPPGSGINYIFLYQCYLVVLSVLAFLCMFSFCSLKPNKGKCVCVWERQRKRKSACMHAHVSLQVCVLLHLFRLSVTHEAWCLGLPAARVSSSVEVLTVGLKSEGGKRRKKAGKKVRPRCGKTGKAQRKEVGKDRECNPLSKMMLD